MSDLKENRSGSQYRDKPWDTLLSQFFRFRGDLKAIEDKRGDFNIVYSSDAHCPDLHSVCGSGIEIIDQAVNPEGITYYQIYDRDVPAVWDKGFVVLFGNGMDGSTRTGRCTTIAPSRMVVGNREPKGDCCYSILNSHDVPSLHGNMPLVSDDSKVYEEIRVDKEGDSDSDGNGKEVKPTKLTFSMTKGKDGSPRMESSDGLWCIVFDKKSCKFKAGLCGDDQLFDKDHVEDATLAKVVSGMKDRFFLDVDAECLSHLKDFQKFYGDSVKESVTASLTYQTEDAEKKMSIHCWLQYSDNSLTADGAGGWVCSFDVRQGDDSVSVESEPFSAPKDAYESARSMLLSGITKKWFDTKWVADVVPPFEDNKFIASKVQEKVRCIATGKSLSPDIRDGKYKVVINLAEPKAVIYKSGEDVWHVDGEEAEKELEAYENDTHTLEVEYKDWLLDKYLASVEIGKYEAKKRESK